MILLGCKLLTNGNKHAESVSPSSTHLDFTNTSSVFMCWFKPPGVTQVVWHCKGGDRSKGCKGRTGRKASELFQADILVVGSEWMFLLLGLNMKQLKIYKTDVGKDSSLHFCLWVGGKGWEFTEYNLPWLATPTDIWHFQRISDRYVWCFLLAWPGSAALWACCLCWESQYSPWNHRNS